MKRRTFIVAASLAALWPAWVLAQGAPGGETTPLRDMSNFALWSAIAGFVGVWVAAFVNRVHWPDYLRFGTFFVWSVIASGVNAYFNGDLDGHDWVRSFLLVLASGMTTYALTRGAVKDFEAATS